MRASTGRSDDEANRLCAGGLARQGAGDVAAAARRYRQALADTPAHLAALYLLGVALRHLGDAEAGRIAGDRGRAIDPLDVPASTLSGLTRLELGDRTGASRCLRRALASGPADFHALNNMGLSDREHLRLDDAVHRHGRSLTVSPGNPAARWNLVNAHLMSGEWAKAWPDFELRHQIQGSYPHSLTQPRWTGEPHPGRLLIHDEIGYGDVFNFLRYVPLARSRVGNVILEVKPGIERLLAGYPGIDRIAVRSAAPLPTTEYDIYVPLESLPGIFQTEVASIPPLGSPPSPSAGLLEQWHHRLTAIARPRVAIAWAGNSGSQLDLARSCSLEHLAPLTARTDLSIVSVQKGSRIPASTLAALGIHDLGPELTDFADTAAVLSLMDAVVSVETSVAHLAGALMRPTIVLLAYVPAWRWLLERSDTPWYPTVRLARQPSTADWPGAVAAANHLLDSMLAGAAGTP